jgi:hypothetical protein
MNALVRPHNPSFTVQSILERSGNTIAQCFVDDPNKQLPMAAKLLSHNEKSVVMRIKMHCKSLIVKAFDRTNPETVWSFRRELSVAQRLGSNGLAAKVISYNEDQRFIVFEFLDGVPLAEILIDTNITKWCKNLGRWYAAFSDRMPSRKVESDWLTYLRLYKEPAIKSLVEQHSELLSRYSVTDVRIAKNDAFMHNFLVTKEKGFLGVDFENSKAKPIGWDLLLATRVLAKEFPNKIDEISENILKGWEDSVGSIPSAEFAEFCVLFAEATSDQEIGFVDGVDAPTNRHRNVPL